MPYLSFSNLKNHIDEIAQGFTISEISDLLNTLEKLPTQNELEAQKSQLSSRSQSSSSSHATTKHLDVSEHYYTAQNLQIIRWIGYVYAKSGLLTPPFLNEFIYTLPYIDSNAQNTVSPNEQPNLATRVNMLLDCVASFDPSEVDIKIGEAKQFKCRQAFYEGYVIAFKNLPITLLHSNNPVLSRHFFEVLKPQLNFLVQPLPEVNEHSIVDYMMVNLLAFSDNFMMREYRQTFTMQKAIRDWIGLGIQFVIRSQMASLVASLIMDFENENFGLTTQQTQQLDTWLPGEIITSENLTVQYDRPTMSKITLKIKLLILGCQNEDLNDMVSILKANYSLKKAIVSYIKNIKNPFVRYIGLRALVDDKADLCVAFNQSSRHVWPRSTSKNGSRKGIEKNELPATITVCVKDKLTQAAIAIAIQDTVMMKTFDQAVLNFIQNGEGDGKVILKYFENFLARCNHYIYNRSISTDQKAERISEVLHVFKTYTIPMPNNILNNHYVQGLALWVGYFAAPSANTLNANILTLFNTLIQDFPIYEQYVLTQQCLVGQAVISNYPSSSITHMASQIHSDRIDYDIAALRNHLFLIAANSNSDNTLSDSIMAQIKTTQEESAYWHDIRYKKALLENIDSMSDIAGFLNILLIQDHPIIQLIKTCDSNNHKIGITYLKKWIPLFSLQTAVTQINRDRIDTSDFPEFNIKISGDLEKKRKRKGPTNRELKALLLNRPDFVSASAHMHNLGEKIKAVFNDPIDELNNICPLASGKDNNVEFPHNVKEAIVFYILNFIKSPSLQFRCLCNLQDINHPLGRLFAQAKEGFHDKNKSIQESIERYKTMEEYQDKIIYEFYLYLSQTVREILPPNPSIVATVQGNDNEVNSTRVAAPASRRPPRSQRFFSVDKYDTLTDDFTLDDWYNDATSPTRRQEQQNYVGNNKNIIYSENSQSFSSSLNSQNRDNPKESYHEKTVLRKKSSYS